MLTLEGECRLKRKRSTQPSDIDRLHHIIDAGRKAFKFTNGLSRVDLESDEMLVLALTRLVEIIGEASRNVSPALRDAYPEVPWIDMSDTRNRLIHAYDEVDLDFLWDIIRNELPLVIEQLERILASLKD